MTHCLFSEVSSPLLKLTDLCWFVRLMFGLRWVCLCVGFYGCHHWAWQMVWPHINLRQLCGGSRHCETLSAVTQVTALHHFAKTLRFEQNRCLETVKTMTTRQVPAEVVLSLQVPPHGAVKIVTWKVSGSYLYYKHSADVYPAWPPQLPPEVTIICPTTRTTVQTPARSSLFLAFNSRCLICATPPSTAGCWLFQRKDTL